MTASKIYTVTVILDCVPEKVAYLKERAGTLVFQPHYTIHSCGALCTYSLYDKQVNGAGPGLLLLKAALSRLDVGPAYYEDPKGERAFSAGAQERTSVFPLLVERSRGSYAAAFPGLFLLVLRPEAIASS
ncbi:hypothetical protein ACFE04_019580 [Oxalis oulophora]